MNSPKYHTPIAHHAIASELLPFEAGVAYATGTA